MAGRDMVPAAGRRPMAMRLLGANSTGPAAIREAQGIQMTGGLTGRREIVGLMSPTEAVTRDAISGSMDPEGEASIKVLHRISQCISRSRSGPRPHHRGQPI